MRTAIAAVVACGLAAPAAAMTTCEAALIDAGRLTSAEEYCRSPVISAQRRLLTTIEVGECGGVPPAEMLYQWTAYGIEQFRASVRRNGVRAACEGLMSQVRAWYLPAR